VFQAVFRRWTESLIAKTEHRLPLLCSGFLLR
jgi:hypothetical protein